MKRCESPHKSCKRAQGRQHGAALVEVLVAVIIVSIGLAGLLAMQARGLRLADSAYQRSQAALLGNYMMDVLRADRSRALAARYNMGRTCNVNAVSGSSLPDQLRRQWLQAIKANLGNSRSTCGAINCTSTTSTCTVEILWDDSRAGGIGTTTYRLISQL